MRGEYENKKNRSKWECESTNRHMRMQIEHWMKCYATQFSNKWKINETNKKRCKQIDEEKKANATKTLLRHFVYDCNHAKSAEMQKNKMLTR